MQAQRLESKNTAETATDVVVISFAGKTMERTSGRIVDHEVSSKERECTTLTFLQPTKTESQEDCVLFCF